MRKIIFRNYQCPGDGIMLLYAIQALHHTYPNQFITDVDCCYKQLFEGQQNITILNKQDKDVQVIDVGYELIHQSNQHPVHFIYGFLDEINRKLNINIKPISWTGFLKIKPQQTMWYSAIYQKLGKDVPYWIIDAGNKKDFTCKQWGLINYQKVVDSNPDVTFVQIGIQDPHHIHPQLKGNNVINLIGKTDLRQLVRLVYNSFGVITPCSMPMLLSYAVPPHPRFKRKSRGCIVIGGGREPNTWQQGPNQQYLHTCGQLPCCDLGGCWHSRVYKLNDNDQNDNNLCENVVTLADGQRVPKCMAMISPEQVNMHIRRYMENLSYE